MSPSSIFSFSTFKPGRFDWRPLLVCVLVLVGVETLVARQPFIWTVSQRSESGQIDVLEQRVIASRPEPVVVILGNSRTRDALIPPVLESAWGLPGGSVLNLSMTAGEPMDYRVLLERNPELLNGDVFLLALESWMFRTEPIISERFRRFASLEERWEAAVELGEPSLVIGHFWRTADTGPIMLRAPLAWWKHREMRLTDDGRVTRRDKDPEVGTEEVDFSWEMDTYFSEYAAGQGPYDRLVTLIRSLQDKGKSVVVIRPPLRDAFLDAQYRQSPEAEQHFQDMLQRLSKECEGLVVIADERGSEMGLGWQAYIDYGHMSRTGATDYSNSVAERLVPLLRGRAEAPGSSSTEAGTPDDRTAPQATRTDP